MLAPRLAVGDRELAKDPTSARSSINVQPGVLRNGEFDTTGRRFQFHIAGNFTGHGSVNRSAGSLAVQFSPDFFQNETATTGFEIGITREIMDLDVTAGCLGV